MISGSIHEQLLLKRCRELLYLASLVPNPEQVVFTTQDSEQLTFGEWFTGQRQKAGMNQEEIAERLGMDLGSISDWEADKCLPELSMFQIQMLCSIFNCTMQEVLSRFY